MNQDNNSNDQQDNLIPQSIQPDNDVVSQLNYQQKNDCTTTPDKFFAIRGTVFQWSFLFLLATFICLPLLTTNFFADITFGRWILNHNSILDKDLWSYAGEGYNWYDINWLYHVTLASLYTIGSTKMLIFFKITILFCTFLAIAQLNIALAKHRFFAVLITLLACFGGYITNDLQSAIVGPMFFFTYILLVQASSEKYKFKNLIAIFCLTTIYVNCHHSVLAAIIIAQIILIIRNKIAITNTIPNQNKKSYALQIIILFISCCAIFISPFGTTSFTAFIAPFIDGTKELLSLQRHLSIYNYQFAVLAILTFVGLIFSFYAKSLSIALSFIVTAVLALCYAPLLPYALPAITVRLTILWGNVGPQGLGKLAIGLDILKGKFNWLPTSGFAFLVVCISIVSIFKLLTFPNAEWMMPKVESRYLLDNKTLLPVLTSPEVGSYLIYRFSNKEGEPLATVIADKRSKMFSTTIFDIANTYCNLDYNNDFLSLTKKQNFPFVSVLGPRSSMLARTLPDEQSIFEIIDVESKSNWLLLKKLELISEDS